MTSIQIPTDISGYAISDDYLAQKSIQGGRIHYSIVLPLHQVPVTLPVPDPNEPFEDNRQVRLSHAQAFADYIRLNQGWHAGALTVRGLSQALQFTELANQEGKPVKIGILKVPRNMRNAFRIIDGQHRILGVKLLFEQISEDVIKAASRLAGAKKTGAEVAVIAQFELEVSDLENLKRRITGDTMTVDLVIEDDETIHRQIFVDVANNALSVQKAVTARFDSKKIVNRVVVDLLNDPSTDDLIRNRVDDQKDRVAGSNPNLIGSGVLAEIVRTVKKGIIGRISAADEKTLDQRAMARDTNLFFSVLRESFTNMNDIAIGAATPPQVRGKHLIASVTMIRIMAGVYHNLVQKGVSRDEIVSFFQTIDRAGGTPLKSSTHHGKMWIESVSGGFAEGESAPGSRSQVVKAVVEEITDWYTKPPDALGLLPFDVKNMQKKLESLSKKVATNDIGHAEGWDGADVVVCAVAPPPTEGGFYPEARYVETRYVAEISWMFEQIRNIFWNHPGYGAWKEELFGRLGNVVQSQTARKTDASLEHLIAALLHEVHAIAEEISDHGGLAAMMLA